MHVIERQLEALSRVSYPHDSWILVRATTRGFRLSPRIGTFDTSVGQASTSTTGKARHSSQDENEGWQRECVVGCIRLDL